jgi:hypothetical protein
MGYSQLIVVIVLASYHMVIDGANIDESFGVDVQFNRFRLFIPLSYVPDNASRCLMLRMRVIYSSSSSIPLVLHYIGLIDKFR